jgi:hypothetical protein
MVINGLFCVTPNIFVPLVLSELIWNMSRKVDMFLKFFAIFSLNLPIFVCEISAKFREII